MGCEPSHRAGGVERVGRRPVVLSREPHGVAGQRRQLRRVEGVHVLAVREQLRHADQNFREASLARLSISS